MPRLSTLPQIQRNMLVTRAVELNEGSPKATLGRPLAESTLAIVTSAGLHCRGDEPFGREDPGFRVIPSDTAAADILQSHSSLAFDKTAFIRDINVVFPIDRVMGELPDMSVLRDVTAHERHRRRADARLRLRNRPLASPLTPSHRRHSRAGRPSPGEISSG